MVEDSAAHTIKHQRLLRAIGVCGSGRTRRPHAQPCSVLTSSTAHPLQQEGVMVVSQGCWVVRVWISAARSVSDMSVNVTHRLVGVPVLAPHPMTVRASHLHPAIPAIWRAHRQHVACAPGWFIPSRCRLDHHPITRFETYHRFSLKVSLRLLSSIVGVGRSAPFFDCTIRYRFG